MPKELFLTIKSTFKPNKTYKTEKLAETKLKDNLIKVGYVNIMLGDNNKAFRLEKSFIIVTDKSIEYISNEILRTYPTFGFQIEQMLILEYQKYQIFDFKI